MPSVLPYFRLTTLLTLGAVLGCASTPTPARAPDLPLPREPERVPAAVITTRPPSSFIYANGSYAYDLAQTTTVTVGAESGAMAEDTLRTAAGLTYSISATSVGAPTVAITVDSLVVTSVRDTMTPVRRMTAPVTVSPPLAPNPMATGTDSAALLSSCDAAEEAARALAGDVYIQIPVVIERGQRWSDSTSVTLCRGGIPLGATRISRFEVTDVRAFRDSALATVSRESALIITGTGTQGGRRITVRGEGTSRTTFTFDLGAGRFLESVGESVLRLAFETIQQTDQIIQRSTSSVRLRAALPSTP